jgi:hypothetical protein
MPFADGLDTRQTLLDVKTLGSGAVVLSYRLDLEHSRSRRPERLDPVLAGMQDQPPGAVAMRGGGTAVVTPATIPDHALGVVW